MSARKAATGGIVGQGCPPVHAQFRPGQSGNPRGRPKGSKNFQKIVEGILNEQVDVAENGRRRKVSKLELVIRQLVNKAGAGEIKNTMLLLKVLVAGMSTTEASSRQPRSLSGGQSSCG